MRGLKNIRLPHYNYKENGYYFVTIVARKRQRVFSGKESVLERELNDTVANIAGVSVDTKIIMPNHVHIIFFLNDSQLPLGEIVRRFKSKVSHALGVPTWQPNYYEHVIRDERALNQIREYVSHNPELEILKFDRFYEPDT